MLSRMGPQQQRGPPNQQQPQMANQTGQKAAAGGAQTQQQAPAKAPPQRLTAESLHEHQEALQRSRAASIVKNQNKNRPPAAPTSSHLPFSFGQPSPQGVPVIYNHKNELTQDKLVLPAVKKRKNNNQASAASTPAQASQTPGSQASPSNKVESPEMQRAPATSVTRLRCNIPDCKTQPPFISHADLDKHMAEVHPPKEEEITDPLAYCLEGFRIVLNLDENGKAKPVEPTSTNNAQSSVMRKSASLQGQNVKQEIATPMSRNPTGTGPSPSSYLLRTPQPSGGVKTPASDTKSGGQAVGAKSTPLKHNESALEDLWANARVPKHWFPSVFSDVADLNRPVSTDFLTDWLERNPFDLAVHDSSSNSKHSRLDSDISANDELDINLTGHESNSDWIPPDWLDDGQADDLAASVLDRMLEMDWETAFGGDEAEGKDAGSDRHKKRDEADASAEFLKVYAPERSQERVKREQERRR